MTTPIKRVITILIILHRAVSKVCRLFTILVSLFSICFYSEGSVAEMARYMWGVNFCMTVTTIMAICITLPEAQQTQNIESVTQFISLAANLAIR